MMRKNNTMPESLGAVYIYTRVNLKDRKFTKNITVGAITNRPPKERGITLISLIVTIIILLILAGISIALISGSNGILGKASGAVDTNDQATATEKMEMKITYFNVISYGENTRKANLQELAEGMFQDKEIEYVKIKEQKVASLEAINVSGESSIFVKLKEYPYEFEIGSDLQLASVDGVKIADNETAKGETVSREEYNQMLEKTESLESEVQNLRAQAGKLLWENPNINATFTTQTVTLSDSLENYKSVKILFVGTGYNGSCESPIVNGNSNGILENSVYASGWSGHPLYYRYWTASNNSIDFGSAYTSGNGSNNAVNNDVAIPYYIMGYNF